MSKQTGNFLTLHEGIEKYSADGMRLALADSGDGVDDANFVQSVADAVVLRLYNFLEWTRDMATQFGGVWGQEGAVQLGCFSDRVFENEMNRAINETKENYERMLFKEAIRTGFYEYQAIRDRYREFSLDGMNPKLVKRFIETQALILAPVCPHVAEQVWLILGKGKSIMHEKWPTTGTVDEMLCRKAGFLDDAVREFRLRLKAVQQPKGKGKQTTIVEGPPTHAVIYVAKEYPSWQGTVLSILKEMEGGKGELPGNKEISVKLGGVAELKKVAKKTMPFVQLVKENFATKGLIALETTSPFDEQEVFADNLDYLVNTLELDEITVLQSTEGTDKIREECAPGKPFIVFSTEKGVELGFVNPQVGTGLFEIRMEVLEGDDQEKLRRRIVRNNRGLKKRALVDFWRYEDIVCGPRAIPSVEDPYKGRAKIESGEVFRLDRQNGKVILCRNGRECEVGEKMAYFVLS